MICRDKGVEEVCGVRSEVTFKELDDAVIDRFDHKHLNADCPEFATLNPSVENIARVCHDLLEPRFADSGAALAHVEVWETPKTSARYPA